MNKEKEDIVSSKAYTALNTLITTAYLESMQHKMQGPVPVILKQGPRVFTWSHK